MRAKNAPLSRKKRLVAALFRSHSALLDRMNRVPLFVNYIRCNPNSLIFEDRLALYRHINRRIGDVPINYLEFGVHQGESIRQWSSLNRNPASRFVGFDSFEGLPEAWDYLDKGAFSTGGQLPTIADNRVSFVPGWFQDTLDGFLHDFMPRGRIVINNDSDLYSSTLYTLTKLDHLLVSGTIVIFDEFDDVQHEFRAMQDYVAAYRKNLRLLGGNNRFRTAAFEVV